MSGMQMVLTKEAACSIRTISPAEAKRRMEAGEELVLVDVRSAEEYAQGHIKGSRSLPLDSLPYKANEVIADKDAAVVVYCLSGGRSAAAAAKLAHMGYRNVLNMGGVVKWPYGLVR